MVSKLDYVMRDLGINKVIIVNTGGHRSGADHAAERLSIDLWGTTVTDEVCAAVLGRLFPWVPEWDGTIPTPVGHAVAWVRDGTGWRAVR